MSTVIAICIFVPYESVRRAVTLVALCWFKRLSLPTSPPPTAAAAVVHLGKPQPDHFLPTEDALLDRIQSTGQSAQNIFLVLIYTDGQPELSFLKAVNLFLLFVFVMPLSLKECIAVQQMRVRLSYFSW